MEQVLVKRLLTLGSLVIVLSLKECKDSLHSQHASVFTKILPPFAFWTHFNALVFIFEADTKMLVVSQPLKPWQH